MSVDDRLGRRLYKYLSFFITSNCPELKDSKEKWKVYWDSSEEDLIKSVRYILRDRKKRKKVEGIKANKNCYAIFMEERFPEIKKEHPGIKSSDIFKIVGDEWENISEDKKKEYKEKAKKSKEEYELKVKEYLEEKRKKMIEEEKLGTEIYNSTMADSDNEHGKGKRRYESDPEDEMVTDPEDEDKQITLREKRERRKKKTDERNKNRNKKEPKKLVPSPDCKKNSNEDSD